MKETIEISSEMNEARGHITTSEKSLAAWEIASVVSSFLIAEWVVLPFADNSKLVAAIPIGLAFALILLSHRARRESVREIGWRLDNLGRALRLLILPMLVAAVALIGIGLTMKSLRFGRENILEYALWLPLWGLMQQYVLQGFINRRAQILFRLRTDLPDPYRGHHVRDRELLCQPCQRLEHDAGAPVARSFLPHQSARPDISRPAQSMGSTTNFARH